MSAAFGASGWAPPHGPVCPGCGPWGPWSPQGPARRRYGRGRCGLAGRPRVGTGAGGRSPATAA
eukprot:11966499-Alexandrium_andersonii.AAC.1